MAFKCCYCQRQNLWLLFYNINLKLPLMPSSSGAYHDRKAHGKSTQTALPRCGGHRNHSADTPAVILWQSWDAFAQGDFGYSGHDRLGDPNLVPCSPSSISSSRSEYSLMTGWGKTQSFSLSMMHCWRPVHSRNRFTDSWASWNVRSCICLHVICWS